MSHSSEPIDGRGMADFLDDFRRKFGFKRGSGKGSPRSWPNGRMDATDDGAFQMGVSVVKGRVVMCFDRPMDWVAMTPQEASDLADVLVQRGLEARGIK
jgi:hypothetical protein